MGEIDDSIDPIIVEQVKAEPQLVAVLSPIDSKQRAASICFDFVNRQIVLNVEEGQDSALGFIRTGSRQRTIKTKTDATPVVTAIANKAAKDILTALANVTLIEGLK